MADFSPASPSPGSFAASHGSNLIQSFGSNASIPSEVGAGEGKINDSDNLDPTQDGAALRSDTEAPQPRGPHTSHYSSSSTQHSEPEASTLNGGLSSASTFNVETASVATNQPGNDSPGTQSSELDDSDEEESDIKLTQATDPAASVIQEGLTFTHATNPNIKFFVPFPIQEKFTVGRSESCSAVLPVDESRGFKGQFTSNLHGSFISLGSGIYYFDHSTTGTTINGRSVSQVAKEVIPKGKELVGPVKRGWVFAFGKNNASPTSSGAFLPYSGTTFNVTNQVGFCGVGVRSSKKNKRGAERMSEGGIEEEEGGGAGGGSSQACRTAIAHTKGFFEKIQQITSPDELTLLLSAEQSKLKTLLKKARIESSDPPLHRFSSQHVSAAAAERAEAAASGRDERSSRAEEARFQNMQRSTSHSNRPGGQAQQTRHKRNLKQKVQGRRKQKNDIRKGKGGGKGGGKGASSIGGNGGGGGGSRGDGSGGSGSGGGNGGGSGGGSRGDGSGGSGSGGGNGGGSGGSSSGSGGGNGEGSGSGHGGGKGGRGDGDERVILWRGGGGSGGGSNSDGGMGSGGSLEARS